MRTDHAGGGPVSAVLPARVVIPAETGGRAAVALLRAWLRAAGFEQCPHETSVREAGEDGT